ncbi:hypothetical protein Clacol_000867 [Clathrus columnatus]|uniref:Uncharacterized protein n=1 Tax=Clathrus columnatus TaxID=1419009 RepID=A0AAV4ZZS9_9AGAM|nr:hypothetical protein Clacol_000867 [Clathrus columnatus]
MPKAIVETRPNRKLTDFFTTKQSDSTMPSVSSSSTNKNATTKLKSSSQVSNSKRSESTSKPNSKQTMSSSQKKKVVNIVSAEDSDDDDIQLPAIVLSSSPALVPVDHSSLTPKACNPPKPFRNSPLTPRQNLELFPKHHITPIKLPVSFSSSKNTLKRPGSRFSISKPVSPSKRPRCLSPEGIVVISSGSEANYGDDENPPLSALSSGSIESTNEVEPAMDAGPISFPLLSTPLIPFDTMFTTPKSKKTKEIVPSSQPGETETDQLGIDLSTSADQKKIEKDSKIEQPNFELSPCSARTLSIINQIKANAEREAAREAKEASTRSSLGLTDDESELSELSDGSDDLSLDLDLVMNEKAPTRSESKSELDMRQAQNVRRSARHQDLPAPNYKLKLSLTRGSSPIRPPRPPQKCPLDKILKESASLKASAEASRQASSRATSVDHMEEISSHSASENHLDLDSPFLDKSLTIEDSTREVILGKKASTAVGKILNDDREKRKAGTSVRVESFSVWDDATMVTEHTIPSLHINSHASPLTASLQQALREQDYDMVASLIGSGTLYKLSQSSEFLSWMFTLAFTTQYQQLSTAAYRALVTLQPGKLPAGWLTEQLLYSILQRLGLSNTILQALNIGQSHGTIEDNQSKMRTISRLLTLLAKFARSQALPETTIPCITAILLVLGLDELISSYLHCDTITTIETILSEQKFNYETELLICKAVHQVIVKLTLSFPQQLRLIGLLSGSSPVSGRTRRWIAWSMLGGDPDTIQDCTDFSPSFPVVLNLFSNEAYGSVKMIIHNDVDYAILGAQTEILSVFLTDIEGFAKQPDGGKEFVEDVFRNLDRILSKIFDTRAAHLDRSMTKDAMNRLRNRLEYQLEAAMQLIRPRKNILDHFFERKPRSLSVGAKS